LKISKIVFRICYLCNNSINVGCFIVASLTFALNYNLNVFLIFGNLWTIILTVWSFIACEAVYWMPGYYCIVCYYLRLRFNQIQRKLKNLLIIRSHFPLSIKSLKIKQYLEEHNDLCLQIDSYNRYWKKYLTITLLIFVTIICFLTYLIFIAPTKWFLCIEYSIILSGHIMLIFVVTYSASTVSHSNENLFKVLNAISIRNKFPINLKLMVSLKRTNDFENSIFCI